MGVIPVLFYVIFECYMIVCLMKGAVGSLGHHEAEGGAVVVFVFSFYISLIADVSICADFDHEKV